MIFLIPGPLKSFGQSTAPGMVTSLKKMITVSDRYFDKMNSVNNTFSNKELESAEAVDFPTPYINSLILYTESTFKNLMSANECSFYNLMINDLFTTPTGDIEKIPIRVKKGSEILTGIITRDQFLNLIAYKRCPELKILSDQFSITNIGKTLRESIPKRPSSKELCQNQFSEHLIDNKTPFLCGLIQKIKSEESLMEKKAVTSKTDFRTMEIINEKLGVIKVLKKTITNRSFEYYENLCTNLNSSKNYCDTELSKNIFSEISEKKMDATPIRGLCESLYKEKLSFEILRKCALELSVRNDLCHYAGEQNPGLFPKPNCQELSTALNMSSYNSYFQDCPGAVGNETISNIARLYQYFQPRKIPRVDQCYLNTTALFLNFLDKVNYTDAWENSFCFVDPITEKESCINTLQGNYPSSPYSEQKSLSAALARTRGIPDNTKCQMVTLNEYDPTRLNYSEGCMIVYNPDNCYGTVCEQRIFMGKKEVTHLKRKQSVNMEYFASSETRSKYAATSLLKTFFKKKTKEIRNLSQLKSFLKNQTKGIIHGIGCAEKILPHFFAQNKLNQCTAITFMVTGILVKNRNASLIVHTTVDDINTPRIIDWSQVFQGVTDYQNIHPRKYWGLNGLY